MSIKMTGYFANAAGSDKAITVNTVSYLASSFK